MGAEAPALDSRRLVPTNLTAPLPENRTGSLLGWAPGSVSRLAVSRDLFGCFFVALDVVYVRVLRAMCMSYGTEDNGA